MRKLFISLTFLLCACSVQAAEGDKTIQNIESYFQSLDTIKSGFVQTTPSGGELTGTFYLDRPGKLRFDYDPPLNDFIVSDGFFVYYYDAELEQQSNMPVGTTLAHYILRKNVSLSDDLTVTDIRKDRKLLEVTVTQTTDPKAGSLTLFFEKNPLALKKWSVVDTQGLVTQVALVNPERDIKLKRSLFFYTDPKTGDTIYNR